MRDSYVLLPKQIPTDIINQLCIKHYPDFHLDKSPDLNIGYTEPERLQIKNLILDIIQSTIVYGQ